MRQIWDRFGWIVWVLLLLVFFLPVVWNSESFCASGDGDCIRNWLSATGSWAALFAAIPTIFYLSRQVSAATEANENNAKILLRRNYALASKVKVMCTFIDMTAFGLADQVEKQATGVVASPPNRAQLNHKLDQIADMIKTGGFDKFEEEIEYPSPFSAEFIRRRIDLIKAAPQPEDRKTLPDDLRSDVLQFCGWCNKYAQTCRDAATKFLHEADEMRGIVHADTLDGTSE